jgi:glycosyltransferase involved in cell wall biosynthesis
MPPLTIVQLLSHSAVTRGGAVQGLLLARGLQERGHRVITFFHRVHSTNPRTPLAGVSSPVEVSTLDIRGIDMRHPLSYLRFRRWLQGEQVDVVHGHRNLALLFGHFTCLGRKRPILLGNRGAIGPVSHPLVRHALRSPRLAHIIAVADAVKSYLVREVDLPPGKISVVYGSFDEGRFVPHRDPASVRRALGLSSDGPFIVCVAALEPRKGIEHLLAAAAQLLPEFPSLTLWVVGNIEDSPYRRSLEPLLERFTLTRHVTFTGHRDDVPLVLAAADLAISASLEEGFPGALRESLAMGVPVVGTAAGGTPELIRAGENGWVVAPGDIQALADAMGEALRHPEEARRRAARGRELMLRCCTTVTRSREIERVYRSLLDPRPPGSDRKD